MRIADLMGGLQGIGGQMQGAGIPGALGAMSPLLLSMSSGLQSGQGAFSQAPMGLALMMAQAKERREQEQAQAATGAFSGALGGMGTSAAAAPALAAGPAAVSSAGAPAGAGGTPVPAAASAGGTPKLVFDALKAEGIPDHIAYGALGNFEVESGWNPTVVNEAEGAFGLGQWRGDRLAGLRQFASTNGLDIRDPVTQARFWAHEMRGPEAAAWAKVAQARDPAEAAALIDQHYERSAGLHTDRRVRSATDYAAQWAAEFPSTPAPDPMADPQVQRLIELQAMPGMTDPQRQAINTMLQARIAQVGAQAQPGISPDTAARLGMDQWQAQQPSQDPFTLSPGQQRFDAAGNPIASGGPPEPTAAFRALEERATAAGIQRGSPEWDDFMLNGGVQRTENAPAGYRYGATGDLEFVPGGPADPKSPSRVVAPTEAENKATGYTYRMEQAEKELAALGPEAMNIGAVDQYALEKGVGPGYVLSDTQQQALQWQIDWVRAKIRWESGAVIGDQEALDEAASYFPRASDGAAAKKVKEKKRQNAIEQMRRASGRAYDLGETDAPGAPGATAPPPAAPTAGLDAPSWMTNSDPATWSPEQHSAFDAYFKQTMGGQ